MTENRNWDGIVVRNVWRKRLTELEYFETSSTDDKTAVFWYSSDACDLIVTCDLEGLLATPVFDIPNLD